MNNEEILKALAILTPNAKWNLAGDDFANIEWLSDDLKPTLKQVTDTIANLVTLKQEQIQAKFEAKAALLDRLGITADEAALLLS